MSASVDLCGVHDVLQGPRCKCERQAVEGAAHAHALLISLGICDLGGGEGPTP